MADGKKRPLSPQSFNPKRQALQSAVKVRLRSGLWIMTTFIVMQGIDSGTGAESTEVVSLRSGLSIVS